MSAPSCTAYAPPKAATLAVRILSVLVVALGAICYMPIRDGLIPAEILWGLSPLYAAANCLPYILYRRIPALGDGRRHILSPSHSRHSLRSCAHGVEILRVFLWSI